MTLKNITLTFKNLHYFKNLQIYNGISKYVSIIFFDKINIHKMKKKKKKVIQTSKKLSTY